MAPFDDLVLHYHSRRCCLNRQQTDHENIEKNRSSHLRWSQWEWGWDNDDDDDDVDDSGRDEAPSACGEWSEY